MRSRNPFAVPEHPVTLGVKRGDAADFRYDLPTLESAPLEEEERPVRHFAGLTAALLIGASLLVLQCIRLQVSEGSANRALSEGNSVRYLSVPAERGLITDFSGATLAQNSRKLALTVNPTLLPEKKAEREMVYTLLATRAGISRDTLDFVETHHLNDPQLFVVKANLSKEESLLYEEWFADTPGVSVSESPIRQYTELPSLGHLIGYVGRVDEDDVNAGYSPSQQIGKSGVEETYEQSLAGREGRTKAEVNAYGEVVRRLAGESIAAQPGSTLRLSLDSRLQKIVADALVHELERRTKRLGPLEKFGASAVVLDPATGAIKAMVSLPDFPANWFANGITTVQYHELLGNPANPLLNRSVLGEYPPGSTLKPLVCAAGLEDGVITANTQMVTPEAITIGSFRFPDWKLHGLTNTRKAIAESNDIFFYAVGGGWEERNFRGLGIDALNRYLGEFGLGTATGVDLPSERYGLLAGPEWKRKNQKESWYLGDTYHASIGQGFTLVTPLQLASATAAVANGGTLYQPRLAWSLLNPTTNEESLLPHPVVRKGFISDSHLQTVREGMRQAVESGSARPLRTLKVTSAGKTGTAQFGTNNLTHAWFTGFAPYENPELVYAILIEAGGDSYQSSVPVAEEILRGYFNDPLAPGQKLNSEPNLTNPEFQGEH